MAFFCHSSKKSNQYRLSQSIKCQLFLCIFFYRATLIKNFDYFSNKFEWLFRWTSFKWIWNGLDNGNANIVKITSWNTSWICVGNSFCMKPFIDRSLHEIAFFLCHKPCKPVNCNFVSVTCLFFHWVLIFLSFSTTHTHMQSKLKNDHYYFNNSVITVSL